MSYAILFPVGRKNKKDDTVKEKIETTNKTIHSEGLSLWGLGSSISKESIQKKGGIFPITGLLYVKGNSDSIKEGLTGKISFITLIKDVESYTQPRFPRDLTCRPEKWADQKWRTYLHISKTIIKLVTPIEPETLVKWNNDQLKGATSIQGYCLVKNPC